MRFYGTNENLILFTPFLLLGDMQKGSNINLQSIGGVCVDKCRAWIREPPVQSQPITKSVEV